jgi:hypothetical protein
VPRELKSFVDSRFLPAPLLSSELLRFENEAILPHAVFDLLQPVQAALEGWVAAAPNGVHLEPRYNSRVQSHIPHLGQLIPNPDLTYQRPPAAHPLKTRVLHLSVEYSRTAHEHGKMVVPMPEVSIMNTSKVPTILKLMSCWTSRAKHVAL